MVCRAGPGWASVQAPPTAAARRGPKPRPAARPSVRQVWRWLSAPRPALNMRAPGTQLGGPQQLREHWRSPLNWAGRLFGKPLHLWGNTSWLRSPLPNFPTFFKSFKTKTEKRGRKTKKKKAHIFWETVFFTHRKAAGAPPSLHPLGEILREDAPAFLQVFVLVPIAFLHSHEPAFILRPTERG